MQDQRVAGLVVLMSPRIVENRRGRRYFINNSVVVVEDPPAVSRA